MMPHNLFAEVEKRRLTVDGTNYQKTAGTTDTLTSNTIDTFGYSAVAFELLLGAVTDGGACYWKVQQSSDDNVADDYTDIAGSKQVIADTDDNKLRIIEIFKPQKRYLKVLTVRATQNLVVDGLTANLYRAQSSAVTQGATVAGYTTLNAPAEGTA